MIPSRRARVNTFHVMQMMQDACDLEAQGRSIIHMEMGQPGVGAPKCAREAAARALENGPLGYTQSMGLPELRAAIAALYADWYGVTLDPERVVVTCGSSAAFLLAFTALFDTGEKVALGAPGYPSYRNILQSMDLQPVEIPTRAEDRYQPRPQDLTSDYAGLILASPANPSGTMLDRDALGALIAAAQTTGTKLVSDEIYHGLDYGTRAHSALEITDDVYVINSFSKYFGMTGWRLGWMVVPPDHVETVKALAQNMFICAPHVAQVAALAALADRSEPEANRATYARNRALLLEGLPTAGFDRIAPPDGAFYIYADVSALTNDSMALAHELLHDAGVAVAPGLDFDSARGHQFLRFSYAGTTEDVTEGLARLRAHMSARGA